MPTQTTEIIKRMQLELSFAENLTRQAIAQKLLDYYNGEQLDHLQTVLDSQFANPDSLKMQLAVDNITRFIADEISRVFDSAPVLTCDNPAGQRLLDDQLKSCVLPLLFKTAEVYSNLIGVCAIHPWYDEQSGKIKNTILPSSCLFVAQRRDDPTEPEAVIYSREIKDTITPQLRIEYVHWDSENVFLFDTQSFGAMRPPSLDNLDMINPYGLLPFAFFRDQVAVGSFFSDCDETLINAQETLNVMLTALNQLTKYQGFSQPVFEGYSAATDIVVDPSRPIRIPPSMRDEQPGKFTFVSPDSHIPEIMAEITALIERICSRYGISATALRGDSSASSGYALKMREARLERRRIDSIPLCRAALLDWWKIVKKIHNTHNAASAQVPEDAEIKIDFVEPKYSDDPATETDNDIKLVEAGFLSPVAVLMRRNPDLTENQARELYSKNLADKQAIQKRFNLAGILTGK